MAQAAKQPNILYIHTHDIGRYVQPYGYAVHTPNIQKLAEQGVLFRQAFCANPTCSASRASLLTGMYPHNNGMTGLAHRGWSLNDYSQHLVHTLRAAGFTTVLAGTQHVAGHAQGEGWRVIGYDQYLGDQSVAHDRAASYLESQPAEPFFLSVGFADTHREFEPLNGIDDPRYCRPPDPIPDTPETREDMARFKASARTLDAKMGVVFDALQRTGLADNTLVICTTDHGIAFPHMKCNLNESGIGVMLIMRGPGGFEDGRIIDSMVSHIDIFPTLCDFLGIDPPAWLQGVSMMPLIRGEAEAVRDEIIAEVNYHAAYEPMRCIRTPRWNYIRRFDGRDRPVLPNCDDGLTKTLWLEHGWADMAPDEEALYDLIFDPNEAHNLVKDGRVRDVLLAMRRRLDQWMAETDDSLLKGAVPAPAGAVVNDPDGLSPRQNTQEV
ncbi:MAG: sulfatase [Anaerolineales bacterium]|nr:MAG: sulfatase [Anaerolineales bacterium]